jgi:hypothetical protein
MPTNQQLVFSLLCLVVVLSVLWQHGACRISHQKARVQEEIVHDAYDVGTTTKKDQEDEDEKRIRIDSLKDDNNKNTAATTHHPYGFFLNLSESAFSRDDYKTLLQEPYRSLYPCTPRGIHLSQKDNVHWVTMPHRDFHNHTMEYQVSMTLSFRLDYRKCGNVTPKIWYRQGNHPEEMTTVLPNQPPRQFNFTSSIENNNLTTTPLFQSDWIYHITLPNMKAGMHRYFYRIEVTTNTLQQQSNNNNDDQKQQPKQEEQRVGTTNHEMLRLGRRRRAQAELELNNVVVVGASPTYSFLTPPLPHTPTSIALVGDLGQVRT